MRTILFPLLAAMLMPFGMAAQTNNDYPTLKAEAEKLIADGSYARAHEAYAGVKELTLSAVDARWVEFRLADTEWRAQAATQSADNTLLDGARKALEAMNRDRNRADEHDRVWVEVEESLGDYYWARRGGQNWAAGWPHYQSALDWWAGAADLELARARYLKLVWTCARPAWIPVQNYYYGAYGNSLPVDVLENAVKIAKTEEDQAHAHYLLAMALRNNYGNVDLQRRVPEEFEAAIKPGKRTEWYDDALFNYGQWMANQGRSVPQPGGGWRQVPDYPKALELFRKLTSEFERGESRYYPQAEQQIRAITDPQLGVSVGNIFLPDSEIQYSLNWRNVKRIDLALYAVDLTRDADMAGPEEKRNSWLESIDLGGRERVKSWTYETGDRGDYEPGSTTKRWEGKLAVGGYVLEARGEGKTARELVLVSDAAVVMKTAGRQVLLYCCSALDGSPMADTQVHLWERWNSNREWHWHDGTGQTDSNGIVVMELTRAAGSESIFAGTRQKDRQSFTAVNTYYGGDPAAATWKIYATTDRPAYRPKETAQWKYTARKEHNELYTTPANETVQIEVYDPRNAKVKSETNVLNAFGSAWGSLELTEAMPLGMYRIEFWDQGRHRQLGNAQLFRLEEYKLPEFKVSVQMPEEKGRKKSFRLGDTVEVNIQADYYFGGPVANATVEVEVRQNPWYHYWQEPREFPWFYDEESAAVRRPYWRGQGQTIKREALKTDATGKAVLRFDTPRNGGQDYEYAVEARVTDASRREITATGTARVTRQRYEVHAQAEHNLYRPQDKVTVDFKAQDANEQPVQAEGVVKVTRDYWFEIWLDQTGREVKGDELNQLRDRGAIFPPPPLRPEDRPWQLKFRGYQHDEILTRTLRTDTNGAAQLTFTPEQEGYYRVAWSSEDAADTNAGPAQPITAETTAWVATTRSSELGYRQGGLEIIVDKDTFHSGQTAPVMLCTPANDRYVLFTTEGKDLQSYQLVHVTGTVKLLELAIGEQQVPNFFLGAAMVSDRQVFEATKEVIVPPTRNFLTVEVQPDAAQHRPREEASFVITTRNDHNEPVAAEVSFGVVDESVYYIQPDLAGDPRQFFFGTKRPHWVQTQSTFNQKAFARLVEWGTNELIDDREREARQKQAANAYRGENRDGLDKDGLATRKLDSFGGGGGGGVVGSFSSAQSEMGGFVNTAPPMPVAAAPMEMPVMAKSMHARAGASDAEDLPGAAPNVEVRSDFRSTIFWQPDVATSKDGRAVVKIKYPDSLTGWQATARAATDGNQFGIAITSTRTKQPLIVRLEAPRFFVSGDKATVSAVINNNTEEELTVQPTLEAAGVLAGARLETAKAIRVPAGGEGRADWVIAAGNAGEARLKVTARGGKYADAMEKTYTVFEHGLEKFVAKSGKLRGDDVQVKLTLPRERKPGSTRLTMQVTPSLAVTMLDALPYLVDYPYGCTEQTMSRFLPAAITAKTLKDTGLSPEDAMHRVFGGIEPSSAAATHPDGKHDMQKLEDMEHAGLDRLYEFQHADGGWGWWKDGESDHWMTAYVVWGLSLARDAGIAVRDETLRRGVEYIDRRLVEEEENPDMQAWMLHAEAAFYSPSPNHLTSRFPAQAADNLWNRRDQLNAYTRALFALSRHYLHDDTRAKTLIENLENGVKVDNAPDVSVVMRGAQTTNAAAIATAHWGEDGVYWRWSDGGVEATAFALRAMLAIDPQNKLIEPVSNWLIKNRRGAQWNNTRDTSITVLALNDYLRVSGELAPALEYEVLVNGRSVARQSVTAKDVFNAPSKFEIAANLIQDGENTVRIERRSGTGPLYFAANATFFSQEEPVTPAGNEIFARRQYYKLVPRATLLKGYVYDREPLNDGDTVKSGERIETVVTVEAKNNLEYLMFEDLKPAGFEAVEIRSGESLYARELKSGALTRKLGVQAADETAATYTIRSGDTLSGIAQANGTTVAALRQANKISGSLIRPGQQIKIAPRPIPSPTDSDYTGRTRWVYQELRDRQVALFIDKLPQGVWEMAYSYRAETPGEFHALPVVGRAMYVPEIRCNGQEIRIKVEEAGR